MIKKILMMVLFLAPASLFAQKFGHFSSADVLQAYPFYQNTVKEIQDLGQKYSTDLDNMQKEIQTKIDKYQKEVNDSTPANIRARREQEIVDLRNRWQQASEDNGQAFDQARMTKMQAVQEKLMTAVDAVAKEGGYNVIYDKDNARVAGTYVNTALSTDVTKQVMAKLGINATAAAAAK